MNKKWIASLASVCLLASSCFTAAMAEGMKPGTYTEVTRGMYDGLTVDVTVSEDRGHQGYGLQRNPSRLAGAGKDARRDSGSAVPGG